MQKGFSLIKVMFITAIVAAVMIAVSSILPVYNQAWKIQESMETVVHFYQSGGEESAKRHLFKLFDMEVLNNGTVPKEFYDNLTVVAEKGYSDIQISSEYTVIVWLLGELENIEHPESYEESELKGINMLRYKARLSFHFSPSAESGNL